MKYLHLTAEAVIPLDHEVGINVQSFMDDLRGSASAKLVATKVLENDDEYQEWYTDNKNAVHEIEIPMPTKIWVD